MIIGLGEMLWDVYPDSRRPGGAPANAALHASRLGARAGLVSGAGRDEDGDALLEAFRTQGVDVKSVQRNGFKTGTVSVSLDRVGIPSFRCSTDTAFDHMRWDESLSRIAEEAEGVFFGTLCQRHPDSREAIQEFLTRVRGLKLYDVNLRGWDDQTGSIVRESLCRADILKLNDSELRLIQKAEGRESASAIGFLERLIETYELSLAALSLGERGCYLSDGHERVFSPGFIVPVVDTTGCGDAFSAAILIHMLRGSSLIEAAEFANRLGAWTAMRYGAVPEYRLDEVQDFMRGKIKRTDVRL